jgi:hypothetical protein
MKRFLLVLAVGALLAPAALAKGPSEATVTGPGLKQPLSVGGTEGSGPLGDLTQYSGFFPAAFGQSPNPMLPRKPKVRLGPRYTIRYVVPAGDGVSFRVTQYVFPYARRGAVTNMPRGQRIFDSRTKGGWYRGGAALKQVLVEAGLPRRAPKSNGGFGTRLGIGAPGAVLLAGSALLVARRRKNA